MTVKTAVCYPLIFDLGIGETVTVNPKDVREPEEPARAVRRYHPYPLSGEDAVHLSTARSMVSTGRRVTHRQ